MGYSEIYNLHIQLLQVYAAHRKGRSPFQQEIDHYKNQLRFTEDIVQRIFVLNQLILIHEKEREYLMKWCSEQYFSATEKQNDTQDGNTG